MAKHNDLGRMGEDFAARYLAQQGYDIMERDWQQGSRDLDIIARTPDGIIVVFVEVKTRTSDEIMLPEEAVTENPPFRIGSTCLCARESTRRRGALRHHQRHRHLARQLSVRTYRRCF